MTDSNVVDPLLCWNSLTAMKENNVDFYHIVGVSGSPAASRGSVEIMLIKLRIIFLFGKRNKGPAAAAAALTCAPSATAAQLVSMLSVIEHKKGREEGGA